MLDFLEIKQINKTFQPSKEVEVVALRDVNLDIRQGDFVVLSGPSGSGKTTLLNIIGGLDAATSGEVTLDGQRLTGLSERKLSETRRDHIGYVFQAYNLIPVLTARENVEFVMEVQGVPADKRQQRSVELIEEVGLKGLEDRRPARMSGGQQQRVA
ncbi:MAG: ATP-binding cassette domain-containing protein, partial [Desulfobulbaceae bacterium]|nr:ATP-binding cassette domain-containing protein [Desulfobulbaceae bacterium]